MYAVKASIKLTLAAWTVSLRPKNSGIMDMLWPKQLSGLSVLPFGATRCPHRKTSLVSGPHGSLGMVLGSRRLLSALKDWNTPPPDSAPRDFLSCKVAAEELPSSLCRSGVASAPVWAVACWPWSVKCRLTKPDRETLPNISV